MTNARLSSKTQSKLWTKTRSSWLTIWFFPTLVFIGKLVSLIYLLTCNLYKICADFSNSATWSRHDDLLGSPRAYIRAMARTFGLLWTQSSKHLHLHHFAPGQYHCMRSKIDKRYLMQISAKVMPVKKRMKVMGRAREIQNPRST